MRGSCDLVQKPLGPVSRATAFSTSLAGVRILLVLDLVFFFPGFLLLECRICGFSGLQPPCCLILNMQEPPTALLLLALVGALKHPVNELQRPRWKQPAFRMRRPRRVKRVPALHGGLLGWRRIINVEVKLGAMMVEFLFVLQEFHRLVFALVSVLCIDEVSGPHQTKSSRFTPFVTFSEGQERCWGGWAAGFGDHLQTWSHLLSRLQLGPCLCLTFPVSLSKSTYSLVGTCL